MKNRKNYVIDKEFQLDKSFKVIGAVTALIAVIILAVGIMISLNNRKTAQNNSGIMGNTNNIKKIIELQQSIYMKFSLIPYGVDKKTFTAIATDLTKDYNNSTKKLNESVVSNEEIIKSNDAIIRANTYLIIAVVIFTLAGIAILFISVIRHTHRISGPIYMMTRYSKEILNGETPEMRDLREKDEFKEFYDLFRQMGEKIIKLEK